MTPGVHRRPVEQWGVSGIIAQLFQPDVLMPHQAARKIDGDKLGPSAKLMQAVLADALKVLDQPEPHGALPRARWREERENVLAWVRGGPAPFKFTTIIEGGYVGIDPDVIAAGILARFAAGPLPVRLGSNVLAIHRRGGKKVIA